MFLNLIIKSQPDSWADFVSYFEGLLNPILTIINIVIFIKLTLSIQKASENKSWVEKTESLTFDYIHSFSDFASEIMFVAEEMEQKILSNQQQEQLNAELNKNKSEKKREIFKKHFALRIYAESNLFSTCSSRNNFITKSHHLIKSMNSFLNLLDGESEVNKMDIITEKYRNFENELKEFIELGKKFSDEIYKL
ncbi:hypothetical protein [Kaistella jeonii]|uniref:Uncharacterized protein n=1 Tax=Kaistella jeonii TaxID=266749 RepID=A0A0C1F5U4_9FLAO|nr:hypothetical protein [Kaistella jeonii]KIA88572.1 hypothetical protein OA86_11175 [Kaistella jeonii]SFC21322.1 hypothetical protein SAMN05421876_10989 [Kaistella jeonii]VEI96950.1 Uncharacterised protein [Kaistella jeonii]